MSKSPIAIARGVLWTATVGADLSTGEAGGRLISTTTASALRQGIARSMNPSPSASIGVMAWGEVLIVCWLWVGNAPLPSFTSR